MFILFKMTNVGSTSITIDETISYVSAHPGSDIDNFRLKSESPEFSDDDQPLATVAIPDNQRGKAPIKKTLYEQEGDLELHWLLKKQMKHKQRN